MLNGNVDPHPTAMLNMVMLLCIAVDIGRNYVLLKSVNNFISKLVIYVLIVFDIDVSYWKCIVVEYVGEKWP